MLTLIIDYINNHGPKLLSQIVVALVVFVLIKILINQIIIKIQKKIEFNHLGENTIYSQKISKLIGQIVFIFLMIFNVLITFEIIGFEVAILMGGISLGMGFAMETIISNMISGVMIIMNQKVKLGDYVQLLGKLNVSGVIDEINIRYTIIKTIDKRKIIVPNTILAASPIKTLKSEPLLRGEIDIILPRHVEVSQVKKILLDLINSHQKILHKEYTNIFIKSFDARGINFKGFFFYDPKGGKGKFVIGSDLRIQIQEVLKKYGILLTYPQITITTE